MRSILEWVPIGILACTVMFNAHVNKKRRQMQENMLFNQLLHQMTRSMLKSAGAMKKVHDSTTLAADSLKNLAASLEKQQVDVRTGKLPGGTSLRDKKKK